MSLLSTPAPNCSGSSASSSRSSAAAGERGRARCGHFTSLREASARTREVVSLDLSGSEDLRCTNLFCEKVGGPCLCKLARAVERMRGLEELRLDGSALSAVPDAVWALPRLRRLGLADNGLTALAVPPGGAPALEELSLRGNAGLRRLDAGAGALPRLRALDVRGTALGDLGGGLQGLEHWSGGVAVRR